MTHPESDKASQILNNGLTLRARAFLDQIETLPVFDGSHEHVDARMEKLQDLLLDFQRRAFDISEELDRNRIHAIEDTVLAFPSQPGDDMFALEHEHLTMHIESDLDLWPLSLQVNEQARYTHFFLDARGRLFGIGSKRLIDTMNPDRRFVPVEVPMAGIDINDARAAHRAAYELWNTLRIINKLS